MATAYLIHGYIGSGKTTFAKRLENEVNGIRFTHDEWLSTLFGSDPDATQFPSYHSKVTELIESIWPRCLELGNDVILDLNFWSRSQRDKTRSIIANLSAQQQFIVCHCDNEVALNRVAKRNQELGKNLYIDPNTFHILKTQFDPVSFDEPHTQANLFEFKK